MLPGWTGDHPVTKCPGADLDTTIRVKGTMLGHVLLGVTTVYDWSPELPSMGNNMPSYGHIRGGYLAVLVAVSVNSDSPELEGASEYACLYEGDSCVMSEKSSDSLTAGDACGVGHPHGTESAKDKIIKEIPDVDDLECSSWGPSLKVSPDVGSHRCVDDCGDFAT